MNHFRFRTTTRSLGSRCECPDCTAGVRVVGRSVWNEARGADGPAVFAELPELADTLAACRLLG